MNYKKCMYKKRTYKKRTYKKRTDPIFILSRDLNVKGQTILDNHREIGPPEHAPGAKKAHAKILHRHPPLVFVCS